MSKRDRAEHKRRLREQAKYEPELLGKRFTADFGKITITPLFPARCKVGDCKVPAIAFVLQDGKSEGVCEEHLKVLLHDCNATGTKVIKTISDDTSKLHIPCSLGGVARETDDGFHDIIHHRGAKSEVFVDPAIADFVGSLV